MIISRKGGSMSVIEHTSRTGKTYYLHVKTKVAGKQSYFFSTDAEGSQVEQVPDGYEVYENVNGQVFLRKKVAQIILPGELDVVERHIRNREDAWRYWVEAKKNAITVYQAGEMGGIDRIMSEFGRGKMPSAEKRRYASFMAMLRFVLEDKKTRTFVTERFCFRGSVDDWIYIDGPAGLDKQVGKYMKHLGRESFFDLF